MQCPKCNSKMEGGKTSSLTAIGAVYKFAWFKKRNFIGLAENSKNVKAFCCSSCGYLESYAK